MVKTNASARDRDLDLLSCLKYIDSAIFVGLFFALTCLLWHHTNNILPSDDAAAYMQTSQDIYLRLKSSGILAALKAAYFVRDWRPILFPVLGAPFLWFCKGNLLLAAGCTQAMFNAILAGYIFILCRLYVSELRSLFVTCFVMTLPWIVKHSCVYYSELALVAFAVAGTYHGLRSEAFRLRSHSLLFGLCLGIAFAIRPVESAMAAIIPITLMIISALQHKSLRATDVFLAAIIFVPTCFALVCRLAKVDISLSVEYAIALTPVLVYFTILGLISRRTTVCFGFAFSLSSCLLIVSIWWLPYINELYSWVYLTSYGDMARLLNQGDITRQRSVSMLLRSIATDMGGYPFYLLLLLSLATVSTQMLGLPGKRTISVPSTFKIMGIGFCMLPFVVLALAFQVGGAQDLRRSFIGFTILFIGLCLTSIDSKASFGRARLLVFVLLSLVQLGGVTANAAGVQTGYLAALQRDWTGALMRPALHPDTNYSVMDALESMNLGTRAIGVFHLAMNDFSARILDVGTLKLVAKQRNVNLQFGYPWQHESVSEGYQLMRKWHFSYILLDTRDDLPVALRSWDMYSKLTWDLMCRYQHGSLEEIGLRVDKLFQVKDGILAFIRILPRKDPLLCNLDNIALFSNGSVAATNNDRLEYPVENLNDGTEEAWGTVEGHSDVYAYIEHRSPFRADEIKIMLFSPGGRAHLRDISIVASNNTTDKNGWKILRSRIEGSNSYADKIIVPQGEDKQIVTIELDPANEKLEDYLAYGIACLRESRGDICNYLGSGGTGIYIREMMITNRE